MKKQNSQAGFTLMELLLAVALMMVVAASCFSIFSMGIQIWKRTQGQSIYERKAVLFLEKTGEELRSMARIAPKGDLGLEDASPLQKDAFKYEGSAYRMSFPVLKAPSVTAPEVVPGYARIRYWFNSGPGEICRGLETASDLYLNRQAQCSSVMSGLSKVKFEYFVSRGISGELDWSETWEGDAPPAAVRISLELKKNPKNQTPGKVFEKTFLVPVGSAS